MKKKMSSQTLNFHKNFLIHTYERVLFLCNLLDGHGHDVLHDDDLDHDVLHDVVEHFDD